MSWLRTLAGRGAIVLLGDPGHDYLPADGFAPYAKYEVTVIAALESRVGRTATVRRVEHFAKT